MAEAEAVLVLDTQIFLHFKSIDQIPWRKIADSQVVTLFLPLIVVGELQARKDLGGGSRKLRDRADKALRKLLSLYEGEELPKAFDAIEFEREPPSVDIDFDLERLGTTNDEQILASALLLKKRARPVAVVTADLGLRIRLQTLDIDCVWLDHDEYRLPHAKTQDEKEMLALQRRLEAVESQAPDWGFFVATDYHRVTPDFRDKQNPASLRFASVERPTIKGPNPQKATASIFPDTTPFGSLFRDEIRFQKATEDYVAFLQTAVPTILAQWESLMSNSVPVTLILDNIGTLRATNIRIRIQWDLPDDCGLFLRDDFPHEAPNLTPPRNDEFSSLGLMSGSHYGPTTSADRVGRFKAFARALDSISNKAQDPYCSLELDSLGHHDTWIIGEYFVVFFGAVAPASISVRVVCDQIPSPTDFNVRVVFDGG